MFKIIMFYILIPSILCRRSIMPKIEISMLFEELNSEEAKEFLNKKTSVSLNSTDNFNNTTSPSSEENESSTVDLLNEANTTETISAENLSTTLEDETETSLGTTIIPDDFSEPDILPTSSTRPMLLSEFANHMAGEMNSKESKPSNAESSEPKVFTSMPDSDFPFMVTAAKEFIRKYLSPDQWRRLRILLKTIKEVGGSRTDIHRAATTFISNVISRSEMEEITNRRSELFRTFNRRYFYSRRNKKI